MDSSNTSSFVAKSKGFFWSFGLAVVFVAVALVPELFVVKHFFPYPFLFLFFGAVMASAWFGGMTAGLFAVAFSIMSVDYFFIPPVNSFTLNAAVAAYLAAFVVCALLASWVSSVTKRSEDALKEARDQLELRVSERTAALMKTQAELTHLSRVLSMGELTASIAHEIKQPLTALVMNGHACIEWLSVNPPNLDKARTTAEKIIRDGTRAGDVLSRIRALFKKDAPAKDWLAINAVIQELMVLVHAEAQKLHVPIRIELAMELPQVRGDRVQLQQVVLNLIMNGMDAMASISRNQRELLVCSWQENSNEIGVKVEDAGIGLAPETADKIFDPFFTTKPHGIGMGLSVSRSIIESHDGKLWATPRPQGGTIFQFTIPVHPQNSDG
jgi:C4-dicarboxylate-specific signal transduction histidine kinase